MKRNRSLLIVLIGIADYEEITGKQFNIDVYNQVVRLIYMGKDEDNDTLPVYPQVEDKEQLEAVYYS